MEGHGARGCTNPAAPFEVRQKIREEEQARQQNRQAQHPTPATGANTTPVTPGPVGVAAHQAEEAHPEELCERMIYLKVA